MILCCGHACTWSGSSSGAQSGWMGLPLLPSHSSWCSDSTTEWLRFCSLCPGTSPASVAQQAALLISPSLPGQCWEERSGTTEVQLLEALVGPMLSTVKPCSGARDAHPLRCWCSPQRSENLQHCTMLSWSITGCKSGSPWVGPYDLPT